MNDEEKAYGILRARFCRMLWGDAAKWGPATFGRNAGAWKTMVESQLGSRFTSVRSDKTKFYVRDPVWDMRKMNPKPPLYIELDRELALKMLALGHVP